LIPTKRYRTPNTIGKLLSLDESDDVQHIFVYFDHDPHNRSTKTMALSESNNVVWDVYEKYVLQKLSCPEFGFRQIYMSDKTKYYFSPSDWIQKLSDSILHNLQFRKGNRLLSMAFETKYGDAFNQDARKMGYKLQESDHDNWFSKESLGFTMSTWKESLPGDDSVIWIIGDGYE
jgi:hypothetical protein